MGSKSGAWVPPRGFAPLLAAGAVAAVAYAFWPEAPSPPQTQSQPDTPAVTGVAGGTLLPDSGASVTEWIRTSNALMDQGQFAVAALGYDRVLHLDSSNVSIWVDRGACRHALGDLDGAESDFRRALAMEPEHPTAHFNLGIVFTSQGRRDSARLHFNYVMTASPGSSEAERARALLALDSAN